MMFSKHAHKFFDMSFAKEGLFVSSPCICSYHSYAFVSKQSTVEVMLHSLQELA